MQAILFIGSDCYPRKHLQDMVAVFSAVPSDAEIARACQVRVEGESRFDFATLQVDWATVLVVDESSAPVLHCWELEHEPSQAQLVEAGYAHCWQTEDKSWHGVKKVDVSA